MYGRKRYEDRDRDDGKTGRNQCDKFYAFIYSFILNTILNFALCKVTRGLAKLQYIPSFRCSELYNSILLYNIM